MTTKNQHLKKFLSHKAIKLKQNTPGKQHNFSLNYLNTKKKNFEKKVKTKNNKKE